MTYTPEQFISFIETLSSKICHDLISPIGAVNNGLEILEELGPDAGPEVIELISSSAQQAAAKLKAFRLVYGSGGSDNNLKASDAYEMIEDIISADGKIRQNWDAQETFGFDDERPNGLAKIITGALLLAMEGLPKGGEIAVLSGGAMGHILIKATGENASFKDGTLDALSDQKNLPEPDPKTVHAITCIALCKQYGFDLSLIQNDDNGIQMQLIKT